MAYRFTQEQQTLLDATFGSREVWLPMPLDDLVAALVEAQAQSISPAADQPDVHEAGFTTGTRSTKVRFVPSVVRIGNATRPEEVTMAAPAITVEQLTEAISKEWPEAELVEKKAYHRIALGKLALGYAYVRGVRPAVEVPNGDGKYDYISIKTKADLNRAISSMKKVEAKAAKLAAKKNGGK